MSNRWERWKNKLSDIFFEEIEEVEKVDEQGIIEEEGCIIHEQEHGRRDEINQSHTARAKIAYEYPKKMRSFRFPVIPDSKKGDILEDFMSDYTPRSRNRTHHRTSGRRPDRPYRPYKERDTQYQKFKRKKSMKEIEDIPAYMRRRDERQVQPISKSGTNESRESTSSPLKSNNRHKRNFNDGVEKTRMFDYSHYSTPDELDTVFRKRDRTYASKDEKEINNIDENRVDRAKIKAYQKIQRSNAQQITRRSHKENDDSIQQVDTYSNVSKNDDYNMDYLQHETHHSAVNRRSQQQNEQSNDYDVTSNKVHTAKREVAASVITKNVNELKSVPHHLLDDPLVSNVDDDGWLSNQRQVLENTLTNFNIHAHVVHVTQGPAVTRFEIQPELGVKVSRIRNLADDLKLNLAAKDIRIEAPIPGKNTVGIEIPNQYPQMVTLQEIIETDEFQNEESPLTIALGLTIEGEPLITNIEKMPHGLIAGATGSGKSVCINTILISLLYKADHETVKFLLIDPKMVELTPYNGIPHLVSPVITDAQAATMALKWAVQEMEDRYEKFVEAGVRNISRYNERVTSNTIEGEKMPYLIIVIDELADLMMVSPQEVEDAICRIAQKARACGIHLLLATQRPSVDVITGLIKANIPTRIAFSVSSQVDSRTIIDSNGAERLLGKGDMLFVENGSRKSLRLQGPFVTDDEIERVVDYVTHIAKPNYLFDQKQLLNDVPDDDEDELFYDVVKFIVEQNQASTSLLQRHFRIGYNRAARLIDNLHNRGIISSQKGTKPRDILITREQMNEILGNNNTRSTFK